MLSQKITNWLKISVKVFLLTIAISANLSTVLAADTPADAGANGSYRTFKVTDYLTVSGNSNGSSNSSTQNQSYLCKDSADKSKCNPVANFILQIINIVTLTVASLSFFAIVVAGFIMVISAGNQNRQNQGKDILRLAITGLIITLSAYFIVSFIQNLLFETAAK